MTDRAAALGGAHINGGTRYRVVHRTTYHYASLMTDGYTIAHLLPRDTPLQRVESAELIVDPPPSERDDSIDVFGNRVTQLGVHQPHELLVVEATSTVAHWRR